MENLNNENIGAIQEEALSIESEKNLMEGGQSMIQEDEKNLEAVIEDEHTRSDDGLENTSTPEIITNNGNVNNLEEPTEISDDFDPLADDYVPEDTYMQKVYDKVKEEEKNQLDDGIPKRATLTNVEVRYSLSKIPMICQKYKIKDRLLTVEDIIFLNYQRPEYLASSMKILNNLEEKYKFTLTKDDFRDEHSIAKRLKQLIGSEVEIVQTTSGEFKKYKITKVFSND